MLEPRSLAAPFFARGTGFNGSLRTGSESQVAKNVDPVGVLFVPGSGVGYDGTYEANAQAASSVSGFANFGNGQGWTASESGSVSASVNGPGTGKPGDPNPLTQTTEIQISVQHTGKDNVNSTLQGAFNSGGQIHEATEADSGDAGAGTNHLNYVIGGGGGNTTLTLTFQASLSATGQQNKFRVDAELTLQSSFMDVTIGINGGLTVTDQNGKVIKSDPNFETGPPINSADTATVTVKNVPDNTVFDVTYSSSLGTTVLDGIPNGGFTNTTHFNWSLTAQVA